MLNIQPACVWAKTKQQNKTNPKKTPKTKTKQNKTRNTIVCNISTSYVLVILFLCFLKMSKAKTNTTKCVSKNTVHHLKFWPTDIKWINLHPFAFFFVTIRFCNWRSALKTYRFSRSVAVNFSESSISCSRKMKVNVWIYDLDDARSQKKHYNRKKNINALTYKQYSTTESHID